MSDLTSISQSDFDAAEAVVIEHVRNAYPDLDVRRGTVLRDLLIRPAAQLQALADLRTRQQLGGVTLADLEADPDFDPERVNTLLSNFNMAYDYGTKATGTVKLYFTGSSPVVLPVGFSLSTDSGLVFRLPASVSVAVSGSDHTLTDAGDGRFFARVIFEAESAGSGFNIPQGTVLNPASSDVPSVESGVAYTSFGGGSDPESVAKAVSRIRPSLSARNLASRDSALAMLRDRFSAVTDISVQGFGSSTQLRARANVTGFSVPGFVDAYVRTFSGPPASVLVKTGTRTGDGVFSIQLSQSEASGLYTVQAVFDDDGTDIVPDSYASSYRFTTSRSLVPTAKHFLNIDADAAFTAFQTATVTVSQVPEAESTHVFKLVLCSAPLIAEIQDFADSNAVANVGLDFLVRSPLMCFVSLRANAYAAPGSGLTPDSLKTAVANHVNSKGFGTSLSLSELVHVIIESGASRVGMRPGELWLSGRVLGSDGVWRMVAGDSVIDLSQLKQDAALISPDTCVFVCDPGDVDVSVRTEA